MWRAEVAGPDGLPQIVEVTEDCLAVRIPLGPGDSDNYIVGAHSSRRALAWVLGKRACYMS